MIYKAKKKFGNIVSVRDYFVQGCIRAKEDLVILYGGEKMVVPYSRLKKPWQIHKSKFKSKYNSESYELFDFVWKPEQELQQLPI